MDEERAGRKAEVERRGEGRRERGRRTPGSEARLARAGRVPAGRRRTESASSVTERVRESESDALGVARDALLAPRAVQLLLPEDPVLGLLLEPAFAFALLAARPAMHLLARVGVGALLLERDLLVLVAQALRDRDRLRLAADDGLPGEQDQVELLLLARVGLRRAREREGRQSGTERGEGGKGDEGRT